MGSITVADRWKLETVAHELAAQRDPSHAIIVNLRNYCLEHGIDASDGELFVIAEDAIAWQMNPASSPAEHDKAALVPRGLKDRRQRERRQRPRRIAGRRRNGILKLVEELRRLGRTEHRSDRDRRSPSDRREAIRRRHVRRRDER